MVVFVASDGEEASLALKTFWATNSKDDHQINRPVSFKSSTENAHGWCWLWQNRPLACLANSHHSKSLRFPLCLIIRLINWQARKSRALCTRACCVASPTREKRLISASSRCSAISRGSEEAVVTVDEMQMHMPAKFADAHAPHNNKTLIQTSTRLSERLMPKGGRPSPCLKGHEWCLCLWKHEV